MKWIRIIGVTGTAFFSTLGGLLTVQGLTHGAIPLELLLPASFSVGAIQGGLAFFREITSQSREEKSFMKGLITICNYKIQMINRALNHMLLW